MMRILNAYMLHGRPLQEIFSLAARSGCDGLSIESAQIDEPMLDSLAKRYALNVVSIGAFFLDESDESACIELVGKNAAKAAAHGIQRLCIVLTGADKLTPDLSCRLKLLRSITACASKYGVQLCLEPLHSSLRHVSTLTSLSEAVDLIRKIDSPWLSLTLDVAHCFADGIGGTDIESLAPWTGSVHLTDLTGTDQDWRDFPGEGSLPLVEFAFRLRNGGYRGDWELEVIRGDLAKLPEDVLCAKIKHAFAVTGSAVICGELALHVIMDPSGQSLRWEAGGGSGTIATQMSVLGARPMLLGVCGDDVAGQWLMSSLQNLTPFELRQPGRRTSVVTIQPDKSGRPGMQKGSVDTSLLTEQILCVPDGFCYGYLPLFPGYEAPLGVLSDRPSWRIIHDFGYYRWCGNADALIQRATKVERAGFCALINAKKMARVAKETLGWYFLERGYQYALLTDEGRNILMFSRSCSKLIEIPVTPLKAPVDTCGAGDCFTAGLLVALEEGKSMDVAVRAGIDNARRKLQILGTWKQENCQVF